MAQFRYQALNAQQQPVSGEIAAPTVAQAVAELESLGLNVLSISRVESAAAPAENPFATGGPPPLQLHLRRVIERGREIVPALKAYGAELPSRAGRRQLSDVIRVLEIGDADEAVRRLETLPGHWIPLLTAATSTQDPGQVLREFLRESRRLDELRRQWWLSLAYPLVVMLLAAAVLVGLSFLVVPIFQEIFQGFQLTLPGLTLFVLNGAAFITSGKILLVILFAVVAFVVLRQAIRLVPWRVSDTLSSVVRNPFSRSTALARFTQFVADLLESDLEIWQALRLAGMATESLTLRRAAWQMANDLEAGSSAPGLAQRRILSATVVHALTGDLSPKARVRLLRAVSESYAQRAAQKLSWTRGVIEPIAICVIGLLVGIVVIALFMPLISLVNGLA